MYTLQQPVFGLAVDQWPTLPLVPCYPYSSQPISPAKLLQTPSAEDRAYWLEHHGHYNVGLALGAPSGITAVFCNNSDGQALSSLQSVLPPTPASFTQGTWLVLLYRHRPLLPGFTLVEEETSRQLARIRNDGELMLMPPSHRSPRSGPLADLPANLFSQPLPELPADIEVLLRGVLLAEGFHLRSRHLSKDRAMTPGGQRDIKVREITSLVTDQILNGTLNLVDGLARIDATHEEWLPIAPPAHYHQMLYRWVEEDLERTKGSLPKHWEVGLDDARKAELGVTWGPHLQEWTYDNIRDHAFQGFSEHYNNEPKRAQVLDTALIQIARAQTLTQVEIDLLKQFLCRQSRLGMKPSGLNRRLKELAQVRFAGRNQNEIAEDMLRRLTRVYEYRYHNYNFYRYNGSHWEYVSYSTLRRYISHHYGHCPGARRDMDQRGVLSTLRHNLEKAIPEQNTCGINFTNGYLSETLALHAHTPNRSMFYTLPFEYHAEKAGKMPMFEAFLADCWGQDADFQAKKDALQEAMAATLFGVATRYQRVFLLYGVPSSGKSQLLNIISAMMPPETKTSVPPNDWGHQYKPAMLQHKLLNVCGELSETRYIDGQSFKDIVDGTERTGEVKRRQPFRFRPRAAHWFASNHLPKTKDTSEGFTRRWLILSFNRKVAEGHKLIRDLGQKIVNAEQEAIIAWACQAMPRLLRHNSYTMPASHHDHLTSLTEHSNPLHFFLQGSGWVELHNQGVDTSSLSQEEKHQLCLTLPHTSGEMLRAAFSRYASEQVRVPPALLKQFHLVMNEVGPPQGVIQRRVKFQSGKTDYVYFGLTLNPLGQRVRQQREDQEMLRAKMAQVLMGGK